MTEWLIAKISQTSDYELITLPWTVGQQIVSSKRLAFAMFLLNLALPIAYIVVGVHYIDKCKVEPMIPKWIIVQGVFAIVLAIPVVLMFKLAFVIRPLQCIVQVAAFAWFIAGNVWVFSTLSLNPDFEDMTSEKSCSKTLFFFALIAGIVVPYVLFIVYCIITLYISLLMVYCLCICTTCQHCFHTGSALRKLEDQ